MKFRAAVLVEQNHDLVIDELVVPKLSFGLVLVKVICSGICGSQLGEISGVKGPDRFLPHLLGHEGCGEVLECGEGVTSVGVGDRVVMHWRPGSGLQAPAPLYQAEDLGRVNAGWITTFNEMAVVSENRLTPVPVDTAPEIASLMGCAVTTGLGVINNNARLKIGESIVVWGAGGIGLNIVQGAAMVSASPIIAVDLHDSKLALARELGASHTINAALGAAESVIRELLGAEGADVVVDNTGNTGIIEACYRLTASKGRTILVGVPRKGNAAEIYTLPLHFGRAITGSHGGEAQPALDIVRYLRLVDEGKLLLGDLITHRYGLSDINIAIKDMQAGLVSGRCIVRM